MKFIPIFLLVTISFFMTNCNSAQNSTTSQESAETIKNISPEQMAERQTTQMSERLDLKPDQIIAVKAINLKYAKKMKVLSQQGRSRRKMKALKSINKDKNAEMQKVISKEQYEGYEEMMKEMRSEWKRRRG